MNLMFPFQRSHYDLAAVLTCIIICLYSYVCIMYKIYSIGNYMHYDIYSIMDQYFYLNRRTL